MKKILIGLLTGMLLAGLMGCGSKADNNTSDNSTSSQNQEISENLQGSCAEILAQIYETADLDAGFRESLEYFDTTEITPENEEYVMGTTEISYTDSVYSAPMMSSKAYQCVLLRVEDGVDIDEVKQKIADNADRGKWVCVEPDSIYVENIGDVIFYLMGNEPEAGALRDAFFALEQ